MLSYLDDLDSKVEAMMRLIAEPQIEGDWTRISPMFERPIYRRRTIETSAPAGTTADDNQAKAATAISAQSEKGDVAPANKRVALTVLTRRSNNSPICS